MARVEIVVEDFQMSPAEAAKDPRHTGIALSDALDRAGGKYTWEYELPQVLREEWAQQGRILNDAELIELADRGKVTLSFEHLLSADPKNTRLRIKFATYWDSEEEARAVGSIDSNK